MKCPVCKNVSLKNLEIEENLRGAECESCGGRWVRSAQYSKWLQSHGENLPELTKEQTADLEVHESIQAKICPDCGHFLTRRKVGHGLNFRLDRCGACGGIWFDKNEWEILKSRNLHDDVHFIFSAAWQERLHEEETRENLEQEYLELFGEKDFTEIKNFKKWLDSHPQKSAILGLLESNYRV
jgi:Zn-finger nucleic acid-binding protein